MKRKVRIHDAIYLKENRYKQPKESFKFFFNILKKKINSNKQYDVLDIGCANGELIYSLEKKFKNFHLTGLDIRKDLILKAKKNVSNKVKFIHTNIAHPRKIDKKFDIIICCGVISIFDDYKIVLKNIKKLLKKNGEIYLMSLFNKYDYDVFVNYRDLNKNKNLFQSGWNITSISSIKKFFKKDKIEVFKFNIKKNIAPKKNDLIRGWTIRLNNKRYFTNALSLIQDQYLIRIF